MASISAVDNAKADVKNKEAEIDTANKELSMSTLQSFLESRNIVVTVKCSSIPYRG